MKYVKPLLAQKIFVGVRLKLPNAAKPVEALARVIWLESIEGNVENHNLGLEFKEITTADIDKIFELVIRSHM